MIQIDNLTKSYVVGGHESIVLDHLDLSIDAGEITAVVGPSGAGKSTLAQCIGLLEEPSGGSISIDGVRLSGRSERDLRAARRRIGTIFQQDALLSRRTIAQNAALPLEYLGVETEAKRRRVRLLLDRVGLLDKHDAYPHQLSGGQRQRVGIARALALKPKVLLADESTSGLDPETTDSILGLLHELRDELSLAILFITHEMDTALKVADSVARLVSGRFVEQGTLAAILRDPDSGLSRLLLPWPDPIGDPDRSYEVTYAGEVPGDWPARLGSALDVPVLLSGIAVHRSGGEHFGHATAQIDSVAPERIDDEAERLGLSIRPFRRGPAGVTP